MRIALFVHSLLSDWNHGNAHFLRGIASELVARGHDVRLYEPRGAWSLQNLLAEERGPAALDAFRAAYPSLLSLRYDPRNIGYFAAYPWRVIRRRRSASPAGYTACAIPARDGGRSPRPGSSTPAGSPTSRCRRPSPATG